MFAISRQALAVPAHGIRRIIGPASRIPSAIHLEVGEPNFPTPEHIVLAAHQAASAGYTRYAPNAGYASLREALADKLKRVNELDVHPDQIMVSHGAVSALFSALTTLLEPGDEVLLPDPGWPNCEMMTRLIGAIPVRYQVLASNGFRPKVEDLERLVTSRTKALLINSPGNPTGAVFDEHLIQKILEFAREKDLWLLSDECYDELVFEGDNFSPARWDEDGRVLSFYSFSKTYSMTGWRVGYVALPWSLVEPVVKLQEPILGCPNAVTQKAAEAALLGPQDCVRVMREAYQRRRDLAVAQLARDGVPCSRPRGAFYLMADISRATADSYVFAERLLHDRHVAVAPGEAFGPDGRGLVRISLATEEDALLEGLSRLADYIGNASSPPRPLAANLASEPMQEAS